MLSEHEGWGADLQAPRHTAPLGDHVEAQRTLRVFRFEVGLTGRELEPLGGDHEVLNQFLHAGEHLALGGEKIFLAASA